MLRARLALSAATTIAAAVAAPTLAVAGTYEVRFCAAPTDAVGGPQWSTQVAASSGAGTPPGASLSCLSQPNARTSLSGVGAWLGTSSPGDAATVTFTAPAGARIVSFTAKRQVMLADGSYAEAGVFAASGRALDDTTAERAGGALYAGEDPVSYSAEQIGPDGATALSWGVRCPVVLPAGHSTCGGGLYGLSGVITLADDSTPAQTPEPTTTPSPLPPSPQTTPASSPVQPTATPRVTLAVAHRRRSLALSGSATGCVSVALTLPGHRRFSVPLVGGQWSAIVKHRAGRYVAVCGGARATLRAR